MVSAIGRARDAVLSKLTGYNGRALHASLQESLARVEQRETDLSYAIDRLERHRLADLEAKRIERDDIPGLKAQLAAVRQTAAYAAAFDDPEPLVTVRIGSYLKTDEVINVAVASVLRQTYQNFEVIIANDGPNPATRAAVEKLNDPRVRFVELAERTPYPDDAHLRWMVAGAPNANLAVRLAAGSWIAPLDDDDEFSPDHIERLLAVARENRAELAYGATRQLHLTNGTERVILSDPPAINEFSFLGAIFMKEIGFIEYDEESWRVDEPTDWNLIRRMTRAGVRMASTADVVGTMYTVAYTHKD